MSNRKGRTGPSSVAKSRAATLAGIGIHRGYIGGVDDSLGAYLPDLDDTEESLDPAPSTPDRLLVLRGSAFRV